MPRPLHRPSDALSSPSSKTPHPRIKADARRAVKAAVVTAERGKDCKAGQPGARANHLLDSSALVGNSPSLFTRSSCRRGSDTGIEKVPAVMSMMASLAHARGDGRLLWRLRRRVVAQGVVIRFILQGLTGIEYRWHNSKNGFRTSGAAALSGSRQEPL